MNTYNQWPGQAGPVGLHLQPELNQRSLQRNLNSMRELHMHQRDAPMLMTRPRRLCLRACTCSIYVHLSKREIKEKVGLGP